MDALSPHNRLLKLLQKSTEQTSSFALTFTKRLGVIGWTFAPGKMTQFPAGFSK